MHTENIQQSKIINVIRWILFAPILLIQAGAFLEAEYITGVTGLLFCFFLTIRQDKIKKKIPLPYMVTLILFVVIFLIGVYIDMNN